MRPSAAAVVSLEEFRERKQREREPRSVAPMMPVPMWTPVVWCWIPLLPFR
jgi:hypothetical protein